jgi:tetratricopeptide (TPR) repeat protein
MQGSTTINARYEIRGLVGRGGMGLVYKAYDTVVGREIALKTVGDIQGRSAIEMFYKEWRILANLHHPNIIEIFDIGEFEDAGVVKPFFVMPLLKGMTLEQILQTPGQQLSAERLCDIVSQTCRGLQAIHDTGLVHRDLKPSNIFVLDFNSVKLIDFGIAHLVNAETATGLKGTVSYMSPEQIAGRECSPASDIFALGVVCYEALCGVKPFQGRNTEELFEAILRGVPQAVYEINPAISQTVSRVIHKALAKEPRHRYANAIEFSDTLWKALRGEAIPALDPARMQARIQRAIKAFEQGNYEMATEILSDLEASGHIDPALVPLRRQIDDAMRRTNVRNFLDRARMGLAEEEFALALQNAESALKIDQGNEEARQIRATIQAEITKRDIDESLKGAGEALKQYGFGRARQLLNKVLELSPEEPQARALLQELESREQAYRNARQEKENLYKAAKDAWQNAEFDTAAAKIERVLELEVNAPDTTSPDGGTDYSNFVDLVQSARAAIASLTSEVPRCIESGEYKRALELCKEAIAKYPAHPLPQALKLEAEAHWRSETLAKIAEVAQEAGGQASLTRRLEVLQRAVQTFPTEPLFEQWARPVRDQLALANGVIAKARSHEEHGKFQEACEQWRMLLTVDPGMPGLQQEIERTAKLAGIAVAASPPAPVSAPVAPSAPAAASSAPASGAASAIYRPQTSRAAFAPSEPTLPLTPPAASPVPLAASATAAAAQPALAPIPPVAEPAGPKPPSRLSLAVATIGERAKAAWLWSTSPNRRMMTATAAAALLLIVAALVYTIQRSRRQASPSTGAQTARLTLRSTTPGATITAGSVVGKPGEGIAADFAPGTYIVEVSLDGYETYHGTVAVPAAGVSQMLPALAPLDTAIHITGDLPTARIRLDDRPEAGLDQSDFAAEDLKPGDHTITVVDGRSEAHLTFTAAPGKAPEIKGPIEAKELVALAAITLGQTLRITGAPAPASAAVDNAPGTPGADGTFSFTGLPRQPHEVATGSDKDKRSFVVGNDRHPALWISLLSDRNVGSLTVSTPLSSFKVFLDGKPYTRGIRDGAMSIRSLPAKHYQLHVAADGFETSADIDVEVKKGQSVAQQITLKPIPQFSNLAVQGMPAHTQILLDGSPIGTAEDGTARLGKISPGEHTLEFRNPPRYKAASIQKSFPANGTVTITEADVIMGPNPATITLTSSQPGTQFSWVCGKQRGAGETASCAESQITITAALTGFQEQSKTIQLSPGQTLKETFEMKKQIVAPTHVAKTCSSDDLTQSGWTKEQAWYIAGSSASLPCGGLQGRYVFTLPLPTGVFGKSVVWTVQGPSGQKVFELQKKAFQARGTAKVDIGKYEKKGSITFQVTVEAGRVVHEVRDEEGWHKVGEMAGDFKGAKVYFFKDARIANMTFREQ